MQSDKNKILLPELENDIDAQSLPKLIVIFPEHPKKATMESYLTRGLRYEQGFEPPGNFVLERKYTLCFIKESFMRKHDAMFVLE